MTNSTDVDANSPIKVTVLQLKTIYAAPPERTEGSITQPKASHAKILNVGSTAGLGSTKFLPTPRDRICSQTLVNEGKVGLPRAYFEYHVLWEFNRNLQRH